MQRRDSHERSLGGPGQRFGGGDADPHTGERARADTDGNPVDRIPAGAGLIEQLADQAEQPRRVPRALAGRRVIAECECGLARPGQSHGRGRGGGVEGQDLQLDSISSLRSSPPPWTMRTRAAIGPEAASSS